MRTEPVWIRQSLAQAIHVDQVQRHGGAMGMRDIGLLKSALGRARNRWTYEEKADLSDLAASYCHGIAKNHPFLDGNKRVAFQVMFVFLGLNGLRLNAPEVEVVRIMTDLAAGSLSEVKLAEWIRGHVSEHTFDGG